MKNTILFIIISLILCTIAKGQEKRIDSLFKLIKSATNDTVKARLFVDLGNEFLAYNPDSSIIFYNKALSLTNNNDEISQLYNAYSLQSKAWAYCIFKSEADTAINITNKAIKKYNKLLSSNDKKIVLKAKKGLAACNNNLGNSNLLFSNYDAAIEYFTKTGEIAKEINDKKYLSISTNNLGLVYQNKGNFDLAINFFQQSLKIDQELGDEFGVMGGYYNIGALHSHLSNHLKALDYFKKALVLAKKAEDNKSICLCYNGIGVSYCKLDYYSLAIDNHNKALEHANKIDDKSGLSDSYSNLGSTYGLMGNYNKSIEYFLKSLKIVKEIGDKNGESLDLGNISMQYIILADSVSKTKQEKISNYKKAIEFGLESYKIANEIQSLTRINDVAGYLKKAYKETGNPTEALRFSDIYISTKDSIFNEEKNKTIEEMESKYQSETKQLTIDKLEKEKNIQTLEVKKQRWINMFIISVLVFLIVVSTIVFRMFLLKKKANKIISENNIALMNANVEINTQKEEITAQRDEIEAQRDLVIIQRDHIEEIHQQVSQSIDYAKRIQTSILADQSILSKHLPEHFIMFKPKDKVSGDFYWWAVIENQLIITVADCTGHGVPGAFMSMLGTSLLRDIVIKEYIVQPALILKKLRKEIINALKQKGESGEQKDGMDMALCTINLETLEMQFAGANNPVYIISSSVSLSVVEDNEENTLTPISMTTKLVELKGDKMPVAIHERMDPFTNQIFQLSKGDCIYLMSDGFEDQFGGLNNKKFKSKQLKEVLITNNRLSMADQHLTIEKTFSDWLGANEQIDDVALIGLRI